VSNYLTDGYYRESGAAAYAPADERTAFIRRTYMHLIVSVLIFVGVEALLIKSGVGAQFLATMFANKFAWIALMVLFIGGSFFATWLARSDAPPARQYMGLAFYIGLEVVFFLPILTYCTMFPKLADIPLQAGLMTLIVFGGLSAVVMISKKDFSFLGYGLWIASLIALGLIVVSVITGFSLGIWFSAGMIALASACILYSTSNVLHHYPTNGHVGAALELFASLATLFYYIIRLMLQLSSSND
jgi:FtsH-binding integral membrane protein